jgi:hypothetical protein
MHFNRVFVRCLLAAVSCSTFGIACSSDDPKAPAVAETQAIALRGIVKSASGTALAGVTVTGGKATATSGSDGRYNLRAAAGDVVVRYELKGYVIGTRSLKLRDGVTARLDLTLLPRATAQKLDAAKGGMVEGDRGAKVMVPAGAFVTATGAVVDGMVDVFLTPLDPSVEDELKAAPDFIAANGGETQLLESQGMVDITVQLAEQKLSVAKGKTLELAIPVPSTGTPDPTMPLWSFDEAKGTWVREGEATYDSSSRTYRASAAHMSLWNVDKPYTATCVCGDVTDQAGAALGGARIEASGATYLGTSNAQTDAAGHFCIAVRKSSDVYVVAYHASKGGQSRLIKSGNADTLVPPVVDDSRCADEGEWSVEEDVFVDSTGGKTSCEATNPFMTGCAKQFGEQLAGCYNPQGECTTKLSGTSTTTRYDNGAYIEAALTSSKYYSSNGKLCYTSTIGGSSLTSGSSLQIDYVLPDGRTFTMKAGAGDSGDFLLVCPDKSETHITAEQQQSLQACVAPSMDETSTKSCTIEGAGSLDAGAGLPSVCTMDAQCGGAGAVCCEIPDTTTKICLPTSVCDLAKQQG